MKRHVLLSVRTRETGKLLVKQLLTYDSTKCRGPISMRSELFKAELMEQSLDLLKKAFRVDVKLLKPGSRAPVLKRGVMCPVCGKKRSK